MSRKRESAFFGHDFEERAIVHFDAQGEAATAEGSAACATPKSEQLLLP